MLERPTVTSFAINPEGGSDIIVEGCSRFIREDEFEDYRAWVATALAEARAEGRRQGLEEAAKGEIVKLAHAWRKARLVACAEPIGYLKVWTDLGAAETALSQALATTTPETQKPETQESA